MSDILQVRDLCVKYGDGQVALDGVSLSVPPGRRVGLIGPNGAGKSSLMLAVMGALPFAGSIVVDGVELTAASRSQVRARCGMVFQWAEDQLFMPTLLDDVAFGPLNQRLSDQDARRQAMQTIEAVGLSGLEHRPAHHLSAGQQRSAALATVLAMQVKLLMLDEVCANLDCRGRSRLIDLLAGRQEAMLIATHDLDMVRRLCSDVVMLDTGRVAAAGPAESILDDRRLLAEHGLAP